MEALYSYHDSLINQISNKFYRYLINEINWSQRMLAIKGHRGSGKTTLMLQCIRYKLNKQKEKALYLTADHYWFYTHTLVETAHTFYNQGGRHLFIDEVHKYPGWSRELKNIYDGYPEMKIVFSSSSALEIYRGEADLSRRVITYNLPGLSFREYLSLNGQDTFSKYDLAEITGHHRDIANMITKQIHPLASFKKYLRYGYLPIFNESSPEDIPARINQIINAVIESDLAFINNYGSGTAFKVKKLLGVLAESVPFKPNIAALARKLDVSRDSVYTWLIHLDNARLLNLLTAEGKGVSMLQKPDKVYLENTNLAFALKTNPDVGSLRETFLLNQFMNTKLPVRLPKDGDFVIDDITIEVGGKEKSNKQIRHHSSGFIAADNIETGSGNKIPLWLFGFLY